MNKHLITVYTPDSSLRHPARLVGEMFFSVWQGRKLAWRLAVRDISAQYRQTALGLLWAFIMPLATTVTWLFLSSSGIISVGDTVLPYAAHVFAGTILWAIFMDAVNSPLRQTTVAKPMLAKINFPHEALIVSGIYQTFFNAAIKVSLLMAGLAIMGVFPGWNLILAPLGIFSLILAGTALGLLLTPVGMLYTDVGKSLPLLMQFLMYLTPVVFPMPTSGWVATVFEWNPLTPLILTARDWLTGMDPVYVAYFAGVNVMLALLLILVLMAYRVAMPILIERMSA